MKNGFTLMEVCVALAVLSAGVLVFGRFLDGFNRLQALERTKAKSVVAVSETIEELVRNPPWCKDSSFVRNEVNVVLNAVPGAKLLAWVEAASVSLPEVKLRRLVRCKKIRQNP
ncbi:prepilin-type N-terminal cleavage/methylation domain-containing protein [Fibrobacter sp.]|uniref:type IV pilus modification PilV family protein n=1 Tax=Fibrobacter sp. TaxID=35828 RepID=UPI00386A5B76